jgi:hypothetical protein
MGNLHVGSYKGLETIMNILNVGKVLVLSAAVVCLGCMGPKTHSDTNTGKTNSSTSDSVDARTGAGTGTGGTEAESSGTGSPASGAGTGTGGTETNNTGK